MSMAKVKLEQLSEHGALLDRYGASIRILGNRSLVKPDVLEAIDKAVAITAGNKRYLHAAVPIWTVTNGTAGPFSMFAFRILRATRSQRPCALLSRHTASR